MICITDTKYHKYIVFTLHVSNKILHIRMM